MLVKTDKYNIDEILDELDKHTCDYLTEESFYPPSDNRYLESYVEDIENGDNFADYCKQFFELLEEENYFD